MSNSRRYKTIGFAVILALVIFWLWVGSVVAHYADTSGLRYTQDINGNLVFSCEPCAPEVNVSRTEALEILRSITDPVEFDNMADEFVAKGIISAGDAWSIATQEKGFEDPATWEPQ